MESGPDLNLVPDCGIVGWYSRSVDINIELWQICELNS